MTPDRDLTTTDGAVTAATQAYLRECIDIAAVVGSQVVAGPNYAPVSACATGSHAVGEAAELIKRGDADVVLAGGTESCIHPLILDCDPGFYQFRTPSLRPGACRS